MRELIDGKSLFIVAAVITLVNMILGLVDEFWFKAALHWKDSYMTAVGMLAFVLSIFALLNMKDRFLAIILIVLNAGFVIHAIQVIMFH